MICPSCAGDARLLIEGELLPGKLAVYRCARCRMDFFEDFTTDDYWGTPGQDAIYSDHAVTEERTGFFETILSRAAGLTEGRSLLDVGAGRGEFALLAVRRGWRASVVEPSTKATEGLKDKGVAAVFNCPFESFSPSERYDCVALLDILEHTRNTKAVIEAAAGCLAPGGILVALTPDGASTARVFALAAARLSKRLGGLLKYFYYQPHFSYLCAATFRAFAHESGLSVARVVRTATPRRFLLAKLKAHYAKYPGNRVFCALADAFYPLAGTCLANKLLVFMRKAPQ